MAANNVRILKHGYSVMRFRTEANNYVGFAAGDGAGVGGTGTNYAIPSLTTTPTRGTDVFIGVTRSASTVTTAADGVIDVEIAGPGTLLEGKATVAGNINTDAKLLAILNDVTVFSRTAATVAGTLSINETGTPNKSSTLNFVILTGDIVRGTLIVTVGASIITGSNI